MRPKEPADCSTWGPILESLVFPSETVGKRSPVKWDASQLRKAGSDRVPWNNAAHKVETVSGAYKNISFEFLEFRL